MTITMVKVRAKITIGSLIVQTPFVSSFGVDKARGQVSSFNAVLKVPNTDIINNITGNSVVIEAGENTPNIKIFTGMVKQAKISPCWEDPYYVNLSISGVDRLSHLQGKKFSRRCRSSRASWVSIDGVVRRGLKSGKFKYIEDPIIEITPDNPISKRDHVTHADKIKLSETPKSGDSKEIPIIAKELRNETT